MHLDPTTISKLITGAKRGVALADISARLKIEPTTYAVLAHATLDGNVIMLGGYGHNLRVMSNGMLALAIGEDTAGGSGPTDPDPPDGK